MRHPISELLIDSEYITNDIKLGGDQAHGMLLYGTNTSGKSCLSKAITLNLILAQMGCYTACKIKYVLYKRIITRLSGHDNLIKGLSSFMVEMIELRTILRNGDKNTFVPIDELCRTTESKSEFCLTLETILELVKRKVTFVLSTHMHKLSNSEHIKELVPDKLKVCHLSVHYDSGLNELIYDRKLTEGSGNSVYGIEVAKSILDPDFMKNVDLRYKEISGERTEIVTPNKSRYNSKVYVSECILCKTSVNLETHHINEQKDAD
ncbi:unnamed protein product, partial [marine sediment metagenome]